MLLDLVEQARKPRAAVLALGMFETKETLTRRITSLRFARNSKRVRAAAFSVLVFGVLAIVPWRLVAQTSESDEIKRLRKENEMLREELARAKPSAREAAAAQEFERTAVLDQLRLNLETARAQLQDLSRKYTNLHPLMIEQRAKVQALEKQIAKGRQREDLSNATTELARATQELDRLVQRFSSDHPKVQELRAKIEGLQKESTPAKSSRQQALYQEELALAEQEVAEAKARLKNGTGSQQELRKAEREVIQVKKDSVARSSSRQKIQALLDEEIALAEAELAEARKRVELGLAPIGSERALQREILKLKRERAAAEEP
jgi:uncharacterized protein involved in exopolysaccharide biosynthesis